MFEHYSNESATSSAAAMTEDVRKDVELALETMEIVGEFAKADATLGALLPLLQNPPTQLNRRQEMAWKSV